MNTFQILVYTGLAFAGLFILSGISLIVFGEKTKPPGAKAARIEIKIGNQTISLPYQVNIALCILGIVLLFLTFDLYKNSGIPPQQESALSIIGRAYADDTTDEQLADKGWVYFGYEKNPESWNFEILNGSFEDMIAGKKGIVLKSTRKMNVRENHYGNFTGTVLNFISPAPKVIGELPTGSCSLVTDVKSVGFSKIWIKIEPHQCPESRDLPAVTGQ